MNILSLLNQNIDVPFEKWPSSLVRPLKACSANANGIASSALFGPRREYYFIKWEYVDGAFTGKREWKKGE